MRNSIKILRKSRVLLYPRWSRWFWSVVIDIKMFFRQLGLTLEYWWVKFSHMSDEDYAARLKNHFKRVNR